MPGQSFGMLGRLKLSGCYLTSVPAPLRLMPCLTRVGFSRGTFEADWLDETLNCATQIQQLKLKLCGLNDVPDSVCCLHDLQSLNLCYGDFSTGLTMDLSYLTALTSLKLDDCTLDHVPLVLKHMTTLRNVSISNSADTMQILRPLVFFVANPHLESVSISKKRRIGLPRWNSCSVYHIAQFEAAVDVVYAGREKPDVGFGFMA